MEALLHEANLTKEVGALLVQCWTTFCAVSQTLKQHVFNVLRFAVNMSQAELRGLLTPKTS